MDLTYLPLNNISSLPYYFVEIILAVVIIGLLLGDLLFQRTERAHAFAFFAFVGFVFALIFKIYLIAGFLFILFLLDFMTKGQRKGPTLEFIAFFGVLAALISGIMGLNLGSYFLFEKLVVIDPLSNFFRILILVTTLFIIPISFRVSETNRLNQGEYFMLLISLALGACILASSNNLLMMYLSLELVSLVSYVLAGYLKKDQRSSEASLKYVIYGGAASGSMIYGMSFLYGLTGSFDISGISQSLQSLEATPALSLTLFVTCLLCLAGFGYKIACVPFHMWCPDVYEGSPTPITAYFSVVPKLAGFAALIRFFYGALAYVPVGGDFWLPVLHMEWPILIAAISVVTMTLGNLVAIHQNSLKRLLAYSSIAHVGYLLMAFVLLTPEGIRAILFYLAVYFLMNMGAFLVVIMVKEATGSDHIDRFRGLGWRGGTASFMAIAMTVFLFSLTGLPPTAGFIGKVYLFSAVIHEKWYWLALIGVLNSVISLYYYARVVKAMFFDTDQEGMKEEAAGQKALLRIQPMMYVILIVLAFFTLLFGLYWSPLYEGAERSVAFLF